MMEIMGMAGFDAVWIDTEHTAIDKQDLLHSVIALNGYGAAAIVRIPWNDPVLAKPVLEMGVDGMIFPYVRSADEVRTAGQVAHLQTALAPPTETGVAGTGVVGLIRGGQPGKTLLIRADMDALPIEEATGLACASRCSGKMHACGHDAHVTWLLGTAMILSRLRGRLHGTV